MRNRSRRTRRYSGAKVGKVGVESHLYLGPLTLEGIVAYQFGSETGFAGKATVAYYPRDEPAPVCWA